MVRVVETVLEGYRYNLRFDLELMAFDIGLTWLHPGCQTGQCQAGNPMGTAGQDSERQGTHTL